jgi:type II secretory pathway pseudopilin PulG
MLPAQVLLKCIGFTASAMRTSIKQTIADRRNMSAARRVSAFTLAEVTISLVIAGMVFAGILTGYIQSAKRAEWTGYSLAAQAYGIQQLEQARSATWDVSSTPNVNQLTNPTLNMIGWAFSGNAWKGYTWTNIDIPYSGSNYVRATNFVTVSNVTVPSSPSVTVQSVRVDTVWRYQNKNVTNTMVNYYAPDQ